MCYFQTFLLKRENDINHFFFLSIEIPVEMCLNTYLTLKISMKYTDKKSRHGDLLYQNGGLLFMKGCFYFANIKSDSTLHSEVVIIS